AIAVIEVDEATLRAYDNAWPLPREHYALLLDGLQKAGAAAVGLDLFFHDRLDAQGDALLAGVLSQTHNVTLGAYFASSSPGVVGGGDVLSRQERALLEQSGFPASDPRVAVAGSVFLPMPEIAAAAPVLSHISLERDPDGPIRRLPLLFRYDKRVYPCVALSVAALARHPGWLSTRGTGRSFRIVEPDGRALDPAMDGFGSTAVDFAGGRESFAHVYSLVTVLRWCSKAAFGQPGGLERLRSAFGGKYVLVGGTAAGPGIADAQTTPVYKSGPLLYVHANVLDNILRGRFLRPVPDPAFALVLAVLALLLGWICATLPLPAAAAATLGASVLGGAADFGLFCAAAVAVPSTPGLLLPLLVFAGVEGTRFRKLERLDIERTKELSLARDIQNKLLPSSPPVLPEFDLFGVNIPARDVSGDYYDLLADESRCLCVLGDVSGKGVAASLLMAHLHASLHAVAGADRPPGALVGAMNRSLARAVEPGKFCTFFMAALRRDAPQLEFCSAGHNPALLVRGGQIEQLAGTGLPLGIFEGAEYTQETRPFEPGDVLLIYSDGVSECLWGGDMYGEERLARLVAELAGRGRGARQIGEAVLEDLRRFAHGDISADDVTLLVVRRRAPGSAGAER
ncbi:MAG TPA: SpoIIE family protein phosphatase, partial [Candidatus Saccharimonadales bacterium]|nr:SpoIIE family protein phosphatase [Candidatus Saccharimonadales bacterium]